MIRETIRNFCIIAHIDHGKSTLADRFLELTHTVDSRHLQKQTLDSMELEREKGITIKLKAVRMVYKDYELNLIDTPGHVDFSYEVSRSLAACEGAILLVDASQGIQAQTVSNVYKAMDHNLKIIPVLNKIDLPQSNIPKVTADLVKAFGFKAEEILQISAKTSVGVLKLLEHLIKVIPGPTGDKTAPLKALVFDTHYDDFMGVIASVRLFDGTLSAKDLQDHTRLFYMAANKSSPAEELGYMSPEKRKCDLLEAGEVGYIATGFRDIKAFGVGDTITFEKYQTVTKPLAGYKEVKPFVFASIYPVDNDKFPQLRDSLDKLALSDAALSYTPEANSALGFGFRCGFLGLLHAEIIQERLEREYNLDIILTAPSVEYLVQLTDGSQLKVKTPAEMPDQTKIGSMQEPWITLTVFAPSSYAGHILTLCSTHRGILKKMEYPTPENLVFEYDLPLVELLRNFFDELKTLTSGYASIDYDFSSYKPVQAVKMDVYVHGKIVEPLSQIVLKSTAFYVGKRLVDRLKEIIPRQQFVVAVQAAIGGKIIARENIPALRKDVLAKMSGGHRERKDKLLEKQKKGKARLKRFGQVDIPQEAFRQVLQN